MSGVCVGGEGVNISVTRKAIIFKIMEFQIHKFRKMCLVPGQTHIKEILHLPKYRLTADGTQG